MNERIKEIERWCFKEIPVGLNGKSIAMEFDRQKFAELIVRECAKVALEHDASWGASVDQDIKRHFGVDE